MSEQTLMKRVVQIPTDLRAMARVVSTVDPSQFPDEYAAPGQPAPPAQVLQQITMEINNGVALNQRDFKLFRAAYAECRQHLQSVSASTMSSGTLFGEILTLTTRIDSLCAEAGIMLARAFPLLKEVHNYTLELSDRRAGQRYTQLQDRLLTCIRVALENGLEGLKEYQEQQYLPLQLGRNAAPSKVTPHVTSSSGAPACSSATTSTGDRNTAPEGYMRREIGGIEREVGAQIATGDTDSFTEQQQRCAISLPRSITLAPVAAEVLAGAQDSVITPLPVSVELMNVSMTSANFSDDDATGFSGSVFPGASASTACGGGIASAVAAGSIDPALAFRLSAVNADLRVYMAHLRWLVTAASVDPLSFSSDAYLDDSSMQRLWATCVGVSRAACGAEEFQASGLQLFPEWCWGPIMTVLNFKGCGVVSLFSVQRLVKVWGPLLLLDRNLAEDLCGGAICLSQPFEHILPTFANRPGAASGDYVACLTENPGEVRLVVLRSASIAGSVAATGEGGVQSRPRTMRPSIASDSCGPTAGNSIRRPKFSSGFPAGSGAAAAVAVAATAALPLVTSSYRVSQETGAWSVRGFTREEFESITEMCRAFPDVLRRPCGEVYSPDVPHGLVSSTGGTGHPDPSSLAAAAAVLSSTSSGGGSSGTYDMRLNKQFSSYALLQLASTRTSTSAPQAHSGPSAYSSLHRACFRNNVRYVRTLLARGAATIINSAVVDPSVSPDYCWTPLMCAVNNPNSDPDEIVSLLLATGAEVEYTDDADCSALYYAIANGYAGAVRALLSHRPTLSTSPWTVPLFVALGAHYHHARECDVRRLADVVPDKDVVAAIVPYTHDYHLVSLAADLLCAKLNGIDMEPEPLVPGFFERNSRVATMGFDPIASYDAITNADTITFGAPTTTTAASGFAMAGESAIVASTTSIESELRTPEAQAAVERLVRYHTNLCLRHRQEVDAAAKVVYDHCYVLSVRDWIHTLEERDRATGTVVGPYTRCSTTFDGAFLGRSAPGRGWLWDLTGGDTRMSVGFSYIDDVEMHPRMREAAAIPDAEYTI